MSSDIDALKITKKRFIKTLNPVDFNNTWLVDSSFRGFFFESDESGLIKAVPVVSFSPEQNPLKPGVVIRDVSGNPGQVASAGGEGSSVTQNAFKVAAEQLLYDQTATVERQARCTSDTLLNITDTATTTYTGADQTQYNWVALYVIFDVVGFTGTSWTPEVDGKDPVSGKYFQLHANAAAQVGTATFIIQIDPRNTSATGGINLAGGHPVPRIWRIKITKSAVTSFTATYGAIGMF